MIDPETLKEIFGIAMLLIFVCFITWVLWKIEYPTPTPRHYYKYKLKDLHGDDIAASKAIIKKYGNFIVDEYLEDDDTHYTYIVNFKSDWTSRLGSLEKMPKMEPQEVVFAIFEKIRKSIKYDCVRTELS